MALDPNLQGLMIDDLVTGRRPMTNEDLLGVTPAAPVALTLSQDFVPGSTFRFDFNEGSGTSIIDRTGNGRTGTLSSSTNFWGKKDVYGLSMGNFAAANTHGVSVANMPGFSSSFTICIAVYIPNSTAVFDALRGIASRWDSVAGRGWRLSCDTTGITFVCGDGSTTFSHVQDITGFVGGWIVLQAEFDASAMTSTLRLNKLSSTVNRSLQPTDPSATTYIGRATAAGNYLNGRVADVLHYTRALTAAEMEQNFTAMWARVNGVAPNLSTNNKRIKPRIIATPYTGEKPAEDPSIYTPVWTAENNRALFFACPSDRASNPQSRICRINPLSYAIEQEAQLSATDYDLTNSGHRHASVAVDASRGVCFIVQATNAANANASVAYTSKEGATVANRPRLVVTTDKGTYALPPADDTFTRAGASTGNAYGADPQLWVHEAVNADDDRITYLRFNLYPLRNERVISANLYLYAEAVGTANSDHELRLGTHFFWHGSLGTLAAPATGGWLRHFSSDKPTASGAALATWTVTASTPAAFGPFDCTASVVAAMQLPGTVVAHGAMHSQPWDLKKSASKFDISSLSSTTALTNTDVRFDYRRFYQRPSDGLLYAIARCTTANWGLLMAFRQSDGQWYARGGNPISTWYGGTAPSSYANELGFGTDGTIYMVTEIRQNSSGYPRHSIGCVKSVTDGITWTNMENTALTTPLDSAAEFTGVFPRTVPPGTTDPGSHDAVSAGIAVDRGNNVHIVAAWANALWGQTLRHLWYARFNPTAGYFQIWPLMAPINATYNIGNPKVLAAGDGLYIVMADQDSHDDQGLYEGANKTGNPSSPGPWSFRPQLYVWHSNSAGDDWTRYPIHDGATSVPSADIGIPAGTSSPYYYVGMLWDPRAFDEAGLLRGVPYAYLPDANRAVIWEMDPL